MRNEDFLMQEEEYQREMAYIAAEKEWLWWEEDFKEELKRKPAKIYIKREEQVTIQDDKATIDFWTI
jgi:hypothetical protein